MEGSAEGRGRMFDDKCKCGTDIEGGEFCDASICVCSRILVGIKVGAHWNHFWAGVEAVAID